MKTEIIINSEESGKRLDIFLAEQFNVISRSQWQKKIKAMEVLVDGEGRAVHYRIKEGERIELRQAKEVLEPKIKKLEVDIIFECDDYIVINKPAGVVAHPDSVNKNGTIANWLYDRYPWIENIGDDPIRPGIVHRLDKDVSGLMVIALTQQMFEKLKEQFKNREIEKEYLALVHGKMEQEEGEINTPIKRSKSKGMFVADTSGDIDAKSAVTKYKVLHKYMKYVLLRVHILTGRTHQIRVHLSSIGHTIVGDNLYKTHDIRMKKKEVNLGRLWLFASELAFINLNGDKVKYEITAPRVLNNFLESLK